MNTYSRAAVMALAGVIACGKPQAAPTYEAVPVSRRTLVVSASASGAIEPVLTVDVKSKASGEIIEMNVQTGDDVKAGQLLASIDPRIPRNSLAQAQANLQVAQAELENARDRMNDTKLRAPLAGTIITKNVELGTVISSPPTDVGGGTVLFKMANLDTVQIRALVDETDIGKVQAGLLTTITVDAYPNRPFEGTVLKVEPQATVQQNVTMFNVLVRIPNPNHLLKPGMNTEVEIHVGRRDNVFAIPNAALRTQRDVASAAQVLGLDPNDVQQQLAAARQQTATRDSASPGGGAGGAGGSAPLTITLPDGRTVPVPPGISAAQVRLAQSAMQKRQAGGTPSDEERAAARAIFSAMGSAGGGGSGFGGAGGAGGFRRTTAEPSSYIVFVMKQGKPAPLQIRTGLTDLDYIEVVSGLTEQDTVLVLPSASLLNAQRDMQQRMRNVTGGGLPGLQQQPTTTQQRPQATPARP